MLSLTSVRVTLVGFGEGNGLWEQKAGMTVIFSTDLGNEAFFCD